MFRGKLLNIALESFNGPVDGTVSFPLLCLAAFMQKQRLARMASCTVGLLSLPQGPHIPYVSQHTVQKSRNFERAHIHIYCTSREELQNSTGK